MSTMLRPILRTSQRLNLSSASSLKSNAYKPSYNFFSTQSSNDTQRPTLSAKLFLEDGTVLTGKSFGCHTAVEGEVCYMQCLCIDICCCISMRKKGHHTQSLAPITHFPILMCILLGGVHYGDDWLSRKFDRSIVSRTDLNVDATNDW
jgi:hypothetical protein